MAETSLNTYSVTSGNAANTSSNPVAVINDGTANRQIVVLGKGDGTTGLVDGSSANPLNIAQNDSNGTGTISATDTLGGTPAGAGALINTAPTASSFVAASIPGGSSAVNVQITGTATGQYYFEYSMDSTTGSDGNWVSGNFRQQGILNTTLNIYTTANGDYRGDCSGYKYFRIRNVSGTSPSNPIIIRFSNGTGVVFLNASIPAGSNLIGGVSLNQVNGSPIATGNGTSSTASPRVTLASDNTTNTNPFYVKQQAQTTGGATPFQLLSAATTNATSVKASAGTIYGIQVFNTGAAVAFLKIYNKASAPTVGTDTPVKTLGIPAGGGTNIPITPIGIAFGTGIAIAITGLNTVADTTAVALAQVTVALEYA